MGKKPKILVVGSYMMDLTAFTRRVPNEGETIVGLKFTTAPGGKGNNQAVQCARLGADVTMVGRVGADSFGKILTETASAEGVDNSNVSVDPKESTGVAHIAVEVSEHDARNRIIVCPGANFTMTEESVLWLKDSIVQFDIVIMQLELPIEVVEKVAEMAHDAGVPVMLNPAPAARLSNSLLSCVTYLSPNEHEAAALADHSIDISNGVNMADIETVTDYFVSRGVKKLLITLGENGSVISDKSGFKKVDSVRMAKVADTTAAGDSFIAAFCTAMVAGLSERDAMVFASHTAAITISRMGALPSLPTLDEVKVFLKEKNAELDLSALTALE